MIVGLVLAGGRSSRFGEEKALALIGGKTLIEAAFTVLKQSCGAVAISAKEGSGAARFAAAQGLTHLSDPLQTPPGPLAGILAGLIWAKAAKASFLATAPCDVPFLPIDLVTRLDAARSDRTSASMACTSEGPQPLCAIWPVSASETLQEVLSRGVHPPVREILQQLRAVEVPFKEAWRFANINTLADLDMANRKDNL